MVFLCALLQDLGSACAADSICSGMLLDAAKRVSSTHRRGLQARAMADSRMEEELRRESFRQASQHILGATAAGSLQPRLGAGDVEGAAAEGALAPEHPEVSAFAAKIMAQQAELDQVQEDLRAANARRMELAQVGVGCGMVTSLLPRSS